MTNPNAPTEPQAIVAQNVQQLLVDALQDAGVLGIDEPIEQPMLNKALFRANGLLSQWARKRWLCYALEEYSVVSTGARTYTVGLIQNINISPRPDRLEYAFLRILNNGGGSFSSDFSSDFSGVGQSSLPVDLPLDIIYSGEDYAKIPVKELGTIAWRIYYKPEWPVGLLFPWPIPQASTYEIHVLFKTVIPRFASLQQQIIFPPEYAEALHWCLARRYRASYQLPADPTIDSLARDGLNTIRLANTAVGVLKMPSALRRRGRAYSYQGDC